MIHRDQAYWARLRQDRRSALAVGSALVACLAALLGVLGLLVAGPPSQARANPLYWLILLPFAWWASGLAAYEPRPVRTMRPALASAVLGSVASLIAAAASHRAPTPWVLSVAVSLVGAASAVLFYRGSLLQREGPAR